MYLSATPPARQTTDGAPAFGRMVVDSNHDARGVLRRLVGATDALGESDARPDVEWGSPHHAAHFVHIGGLEGVVEIASFEVTVI